MRLLNCRTASAVQGLIEHYKSDQRALRESITEIMWHMRGGVTREEAWSLSYEERQDMIKGIEARIKIVEKTNLPLL